MYLVLVLTNLIFLDAVVLPQHRQMEHFIIEEIVEDRCPQSLMTDTQTYAQHYENQYGCKILDLKQPLLRISNAESHHFMYAPLHTESTKHKELNRDKFLSKRTLLVPELVKVHPIPASVWREIQMLPFVLDRLSSFVKIHHFLEDRLMKELNQSMYTLEKPRSLTYSLLNKPEIPFNRLVTLGSKCENRKIDINDMLEAVTLRGAGEMFDMEKLETLGDSFLKYSMTLGEFKLFPDFFLFLKLK